MAQKWVREVKERTFGGATPDLGYRGDEDQGQAGALGVMMAIGLFQVRGGAEVDPVYEITSPIFDRVTIHLDPDYYPGRKFVILTRNNSRENCYIQSAALNGRPLTRPWFYHRDLVQGGTLELVLGPRAEQALGQPSRGRPAFAAPRLTEYAGLPRILAARDPAQRVHWGDLAGRLGGNVVVVHRISPSLGEEDDPCIVGSVAVRRTDRPPGIL